VLLAKWLALHFALRVISTFNAHLSLPSRLKMAANTHF
jgi:hypothetical protein